jgi:hypothetical protein
VVPIAQALEFKNEIRAARFEVFSLLVSFVHVLMVWALMVSWFGVAAHVLTRRGASPSVTRGTSSRSPAA